MEARKIEIQVDDQFNDEQIRKVISNSLLFKGADNIVIDLVIKNLESKTITKGSPVFLENELNDKVYFIKSGKVEITYFQKDFNRMNQAAILSSGDYFAELSVLTKGNTSASAIVHENCELLYLNGDRFIQILKKFPDISKRLARDLGKLVSQFIDSHSYITYFNEDQIEMDLDVLSYLPVESWKKIRSIPLSIKGNVLAIASISPRDSDVQQYFKAFKDIKIEIHLINEETFNSQYDVLSKKYRSFRPTKDNEKSCYEDEIESDDMFKVRTINTNPLFNSLPDKVRSQLMKHLQIKLVKKNEVIFDSSTSVNVFYILSKGAVTILKEVENSDMLACVSKLKTNESFGILPVLLDENRYLTAIATTDSILTVFPKKIFNQLIDHPYFSIEVGRSMARMIQDANKHSGLEYYDINNSPKFSSVKTAIPWDIISGFQVLPLEENETQITLGVVNPDSHLLYSTLGRYLINLKVNVFLLSVNQFNKYLPEFKHHYDKNFLKGNELEVISTRKTQSIDTVETINQIFIEGTKLRASDVHIEPNGDKLTVRYRVDGVLRESKVKLSYPDPGIEVLSRLKIMSKMDITNKLNPQDGQIHFESKGLNVYARSSAIPLKHGEKIVLRLIPEKVQVPPLSSLTTDRELYQILQSVVKCRQGLFLITGPTGSGKTTTLYSLLHQLNSIELNVITVEDPVELEIPGINQLEINVKQQMTFEKALKAILRQDPDCIMIGEIRDHESAKIALEAAMTGHLVLSTLHTPSSLEVIPRLRDLGIEKSLISSGLVGAMTQKLVRKICSHCIEDHLIDDEEKKLIEKYYDPTKIPSTLNKGKGCAHCNYSGYLGRVPVFEGWSSSKEMKDLISDETHLSQIKVSLEKNANFHDLTYNAMKLVTLGQTTLEEIKRVLGLI
ncbi:MAG: Flp pilus assembly complex ATPase component TadA [Halobacteriovoraceae bacterium]|jgi:type IV pilus assembly protein PilB|nr:Flp pilus assembly complex ATPase component TadA [Halobacteriovoraceae bacterium]